MDDKFYHRVSNAETNVDDANNIKRIIRNAFIMGASLVITIIIVIILALNSGVH